MNSTGKITVFIGLGSNQDDKEKYLNSAIALLSHCLGNPIAVAPYIETAAWGFHSPNSFLNTVAAFETLQTPLSLLDTTEEVERRLGRTTKSNGGIYHDRPIDIDILFYGNSIIDTPRLTIPHPLLHKRYFVLQPLATIAPQFIHPSYNKSIRQLLSELRESTEEHL